MSLLQASNVCVSITEDFSVRDISFEISEKGIYGFLGKNGSGKSVLANILAGALPVDEGEILCKASSLYASDKQNAVLKRKIGYAASELFFDGDMTAFEIIDLLGKAKRVDPDKRYRQIKEAFELTGLSGKAEVLFDELTLSEKKRLAVACALVGNPDVIILDDPFRHLEPKQVSEVKSLIRMLGKKKPVLLFSSRPGDIEELCDNVAIMHDGELVLWESTEALLDKLKSNGLGGLANALDALTERADESQASEEKDGENE